VAHLRPLERNVVGSALTRRDHASVASPVAGRLRVLFFVEGFTDIRFVVGLSQICDLTMAVPAQAYAESGLKDRVAASGARLVVHEIRGGRLAFQARSFSYLWRVARTFDVVLAQEVLRGALNATIVGALLGVPVVTYMGIAPVEYFRCRRERGRIGMVGALAGEAVIRTLMAVNGRLATRCLAMGPYLRDIALRSCPRTEIGLYYGVDVDRFRPASEAERTRLRQQLNLPAGRFVVLLSSRMSHEKDPETVLRGVALARGRGLDAVVLNLGGGYHEFLELARTLDLGESTDWVIGRPAVHPISEVPDYFRAADAVVLASLAEGAAYSTLEGLACMTPVVATAVGGMAVQLHGYAQLTPRQDPGAIADALIEIADDPEAARARTRPGRDHVCREWSREKAFQDLRHTLTTVAFESERHREAA
jgi:glycosyltransferase involved in cell wall biosynthesis